MALTTLLTHQDVAVPALTEYVSFVVPAGKRYAGSDIIYQVAATERLGICEVDLINSRVALLGMDSVDGQHVLRVFYAEDVDINTTIDADATLAQRITDTEAALVSLTNCLRSMANKLCS